MCWYAIYRTKLGRVSREAVRTELFIMKREKKGKTKHTQALNIPTPYNPKKTSKMCTHYTRQMGPPSFPDPSTLGRSIWTPFWFFFDVITIIIKIYVCLQVDMYWCMFGCMYLYKSIRLPTSIASLSAEAAAFYSGFDCLTSINVWPVFTTLTYRQCSVFCFLENSSEIWILS